MKHEYEGHLFGHYDSRGGATFVVAATKDEAYTKYQAALWPGEPLEPDWKESVDFDYIGPAKITSWRPIEENEDLEYREEGDQQTLWTNVPNKDGDGIIPDELPNPTLFEFTQDKTKPEGMTQESFFGEDACGMIFIAENHA